MVCVERLNEYFSHLSHNTNQLLPDGIIDISLKELHSFGLLEESSEEPNNTLHVIERENRITLFDDHFIVWIVPHTPHQAQAYTLVYIASWMPNSFKPELCFRTKGIHNRAKTIMRLVTYFLAEIQENDAVMSYLHS